MTNPKNKISSKTTVEDLFQQQINATDLPAPVREHKAV